MALRVLWSPRADKDFDRINDYLLETWSEKVLMRFVQETFSKIDPISHFPKMYRETAQVPGVRKCPVNRQVSLYYRVRENETVELYFVSDGFVSRHMTSKTGKHGFLRPLRLLCVPCGKNITHAFMRNEVYNFP